MFSKSYKAFVKRILEFVENLKHNVDMIYRTTTLYLILLQKRLHTKYKTRP